MEETKTAIEKYIDEKKKLQKLVLNIIDEINPDEISYQNLLTFLDNSQYKDNKSELKHFLHFILIISTNYHREPYFFNKIEKILTLSSKFYQPIFSNKELFLIFYESKPILLFLLKSKIITIDEIIFRQLTCFSEMIENKRYYYFYPELKSIIESGTIKNIDEQKYQIDLNEDIENFEINRQSFENESKLCHIIRNDLIDDFIQYVNQFNISLSSQIQQSLFETNSIFLEKEPTLIEYATFYGSIRIMIYLCINKVELSPTLWLYGVHSNNAEVIQFLEDKQISMDDSTFSEAIKCHHNDIANYIHDNCLDKSNALLSDTSIYFSENYEFFSNEINDNTFFTLCQNDYSELVNLYLESKKEEIEKYIKELKVQKPKLQIRKSLNNNNIIVVYYLLLKFDGISENIFQNKTNIKRIALPPSIRSIGSYAFSKCSSLEEISISSSTTKIGKEAFSECSSLKQITIPSFLTSIGCKAFCKCKSLTQITIPPFVTTIGDCAFDKCSSLTQITIPPSVTSFGKGVFCECESLIEVSFPSSFTSIGVKTFMECSSLSKISFSPFLSSFDNNVFLGCSSLTQITIPSSVTAIGYGAFERCYHITQIIIPSSVESIGNYGFADCRSLEKITFITPSSLQSIGDFGFSGCSSLKQISVPPSVKTVGPFAFYECYSLVQASIPSVTSIGYSVFRSCFALKQLTISSLLLHRKDYIEIDKKVNVTTID